MRIGDQMFSSDVPHIAFILHEKTYLRSWLHSGVLNELAATLKVEIFVDRSKVDLGDWSNSSIPVKDLILNREDFSANLLNDALLFERRHLSPTFGFQIERYFRGWYYWRFNSSLVQRFKLQLKRIKRLRIFLYSCLRLMLIFAPLRKPVLKRLTAWIEKQDVLVNVHELANFDLVIIPSNGVDNLLNPLLTQLDRYGIRTLVALDNWDNMSSKTNFWTKPTYLSAMGAQSARHAEQIQGISKNDIWVIGSPRFETYRPFLKSASEYRERKGNFLYLGCSIPHNEKTLITKLVTTTDFGGRKLVYRPHPHRIERIGDSNQAMHDVAIEIDENVRAINPETGQPEMTGQFVASLQDALLVIATPTTLALEAMLLGARVVIDATDDGVSRSTAARALKRYLHLRDLLNVPGLPIAHDIVDLQEQILFALAETTRCGSNYGISDLLFFSPDSYALELSRRIKGIDCQLG